MNTKLILEIAALGAVAFGAYTIGKVAINQMKAKKTDEKSSFVGRVDMLNRRVKPIVSETVYTCMGLHGRSGWMSTRPCWRDGGIDVSSTK